MTPEEFKARLDRIYDSTDGLYKSLDIEKMHSQADDLMCEALESLGFDVSRFRESERWYA